MKSRLYFFIYCFAVIFLSFPFLSQAQNVLSLDNCINIAIKNNSQYRNAQNREQMAGAQVLSAYSGFLPQFSFNAGGSQQHQGSLTRYYNTAVYKYDDDGKPVRDEEDKPIVERYVRTLNETEPQIRNNFSMGGSISQLIYDGGRWWNQLRRQYSNKNARALDVEISRLNTIFRVKQSYYEILRAQNQLIVLEEAVNLAEEQLKSSRTRFEIGSVAEIDVLRSQVNLNNQRIQLFTQQNEVEIAKANLNTIMGREINTPLIVMEDSTIGKEPTPLEEALSLVERNNPSVKMSQEEINAAQYSYNASKGSLLPTITANLGYSRFNPDVQLVYKSFDRNYSWSYGLSFSMPIFDGLRTKSNIQYESSNLKIAEENLLEAKRVLFNNVKQYHLNLTNNLNKIRMLEENLSVAEENVRLTLERYNIGSGTLLETIDAQVSFTRSRMEFVGAIYDAKISRARLESLIGGE